jgi:carbamoyl-phosphate synthase small subunit
MGFICKKRRNLSRFAYGLSIGLLKWRFYPARQGLDRTQRSPNSLQTHYHVSQLYLNGQGDIGKSRVDYGLHRFDRVDSPEMCGAAPVPARPAFSLSYGICKIAQMHAKAQGTKSTLSSSKKAYLVLEDGTVFEGRSCGYEGEAQGEVVFHTAMTGYQEILTDPSYKGQIVTMTYPLIGNTGCNAEDIESGRPWVEGFVLKEMAAAPSNWRSSEGLPDYLRRHRIPAIQGIDTRKLTRVLRQTGAQRGLLTTKETDLSSLRMRVKTVPSIVGIDLVKEVSASEPYRWQEGTYEWPQGYPDKRKSDHFIVAYDFGIKRNILRRLVSQGMDVLVVPASTPAAEVLRLKPDGVFLSNGPGDPEPVFYAIENIRALIGRVPLFGICLGHQLVGLALGGKTYKLKFGHHGANHPVKNLETGAIEITSQNHGFAVDIDSLQGLARLTHVNLNDRTSEGLSVRDRFLFTVQYHPESSPGPHDSGYLFRDFARMMADFKGK